MRRHPRQDNCAPAARSAFEHLEPRFILAAAVWDGGLAGTGTNWHDQVNWVGDTLPGDGDDVTINVAADPQITFTTGTLTLASLLTTEALGVNGGTLGVSGTADIDATLSLLGGEIRGGSWDVTGGLLRPLANSSNRITDAAIVGEITIDQGNGRVRVEGTTTFTLARLAASTTTLGFAGGSSLPGDVLLEGTGTGVRAITLFTPGSFTIPAGRSITSAVGFDGTVQIGGSHHYSSSMDLVNEGTIDIESGAARVVNINATTTANASAVTVHTATLRFNNALDNTGDITGDAGDIDLLDAWANAGGTINITDAGLLLGGSFATAGIGTLHRAGSSTVTLTGALDNTGDTLAFSAATGSWTMLAGSVTGGQITSADGEKLAFGTNSSNRLTDVTVVGDLVLDISSGRVRIAGSTTWGLARLTAGTTALGFEPGATLPGDVVFEGASGHRGLTMVAAGTFTIPADRTVSANPGYAGTAQIGGSWHWSGAMSLTNEGTVGFVSTAGKSFDFESASTLNSGDIAVTTGGIRFQTGVTNTGAITATGATLSLVGAWDNSAGLIDITDTALTLGGSFTTAGIGTLTRAGSSTVTLTGALDNTGDTLAFSAATGSWTMLAGSVTGGQITSADGEKLAFGTNSSNRLTDVTVVGDLVLDINSGRVRIEGSTTWGLARLAAGTTALGFEPGATLPGDVVFEGASGNRGLTMLSAGSFTIPAGRAVYADPGYAGTAQIGGSWHWSGAMSLINEGTIEFTSDAGDSLDFDAASTLNIATITAHTAKVRLPNGVVNLGTITGDGGNIEIDGAWDNTAGVLHITDATLDLGGSFTTAGIGTIVRVGATGVLLTGDLDNTGDSLGFDAASGSWELSGGSVTGGTLSHADGERLAIGTNSSNHLIDVSVVGGLVLDIAGGRVQIVGTTTWDIARLAASIVTLGFAGGATVPGDVVFEGTAASRALTMVSAGTLTVPAGVTISTDPAFSAMVQIGGSHHWTGAMDLVVEGELLIGNTGGASMRIIPATLANAGLIASTGQTLTIEPTATLVNTGTLRAQGGGTLEIDRNGAAWTNDGTLAAGPGSTVHILGDLTLTASSTVRIEINGFTGADIGLLEVDGLLTRAGTMQVAGVDGWGPECVLQDCVSAGASAGAFDTLDLPVPPAGHNSFLIFVPDGTTIRFAISPASDWNADGRLDTLDFLAYLNDWVSRDPNADFNHDGRIDTLDFLAFLNSWVEGC